MTTEVVPCSGDSVVQGAQYQVPDRLNGRAFTQHFKSYTWQRLVEEGVAEAFGVLNGRAFCLAEKKHRKKLLVAKMYRFYFVEQVKAGKAYPKGFRQVAICKKAGIPIPVAMSGSHMPSNHAGAPRSNGIAKKRSGSNGERKPMFDRPVKEWDADVLTAMDSVTRATDMIRDGLQLPADLLRDMVVSPEPVDKAMLLEVRDELMKLLAVIN